MKYAHILAEICRQHWAITSTAMEGILSALDGRLGAEDRPTFHAAHVEEIVAQLGERAGESGISTVLDGIGIIQINGPIIPRGTAFSESSGIVSIDRLASEFKAFENDPGISKILLVLDSPGGSVVGISEFASMIATSTKPTASYVYGFAASAAYWIASATDEIITSDTGLVGSVGVVLSVARKTDEDPIEIVSSQSPKKRLDVESDEGRLELQTVVDGLADVFIGAVAKNRSTTPAKVSANFGGGAMVLAPAALASGMVDGVATLDEYLGALAGRGDLSSSHNVIDTSAGRGDTNQDDGPSGLKKSLREATAMDLQKLLNENPGAAAQHKEEIEAARAEGAASASAESKARSEAATKIILSNDYPAPIKAIAAEVIEGKKSADHLETAVALFDSLKAAKTVETAVEESGAIAATPAQLEAEASTDGIIRNEKDLDAEVEKMKTA